MWGLCLIIFLLVLRRLLEGGVYFKEAFIRVITIIESEMRSRLRLFKQYNKGTQVKMSHMRTSIQLFAVDKAPLPLLH